MISCHIFRRISSYLSRIESSARPSWIPYKDSVEASNIGYSAREPHSAAEQSEIIRQPASMMAREGKAQEETYKRVAQVGRIGGQDKPAHAHLYPRTAGGSYRD